MYDESLKRCLIKLVQNLRDNKVNNRKSVTLFLGAGCSLSSSNKDISTYGIIRDIVKKYSIQGESVPEEWTELYRRFTNDIWNGQGNVDKKHLLESYFRDMEPSEGYRYVRFLVENDYINNVITTNFDPMLDKVFEGMSYHLQVGTIQNTIGSNPKFTLLKAHGDLKFGQLRFAPAELYKLPEVIETAVRTLTEGIVIIVGYRGQDMGIIQALNETEDHCAYWITYGKPDFYAHYENDPIINWLKKRGSENNLLYGEEYGDFDTILKKAVDLLECKNDVKGSRFYSLWENSYINDYMALNLRIQKMFQRMLEILEQISEKNVWKSFAPYYAESHDRLAEAIIQLLTEKIIPREKIYCISNEVEGLLFAVSVEIWCICQGYPVIHTKVIKQLRKIYEGDKENAEINSDFWEAVQWLSGLSVNANSNYERSYYEISISLDEGKNFLVLLKRVDLEEFASLFCIVQRLLLFTKTCGGSNITGVALKQALEQALYQIMVHERKINVQLNTIPETLYQEIQKRLLSEYFSEHIISNRHIMSFENTLFIQVDVEPENPSATSGLIDGLIAVSERMKKEFAGESEISALIESRDSEIFQNFFDSESNGLFLIGESGIGKTCMLKRLVFDADPSKYIILPVSAKQMKAGRNFIRNTFGDELGEFNRLEYINIMLEQRGQKLLLIVDAINEFNAPLQQIITAYKELLNFCDFLSQKSFKNILLIITCRTEFYYQIQHNVFFEPSPSSFFSKIDDNGHGSTLCAVSGFQKEEVEAIIRQYALDKTLNAEMLLKKFGNIIYVPIYLEIICKMNTGEIIDDTLPNIYALYRIWFQNIINAATGEHISEDCMLELLEYLIYFRYFQSPGHILTTPELFIGISENNELASATYKWMVERGIFKEAFSAQNCVYFAHDQIEEFFLTQYLYKHYHRNLRQATKKIGADQMDSPIVRDSLQVLMQILCLENERTFIACIVSIINENDEYLLSVLIELLLENYKSICRDLYSFLKELEQYICKSVFEDFISRLYSKAHDKMDHFQIFDIEIMDSLDTYINQSNIGSSFFMQGLNYYSYARYIWTFPVERPDRAYDFAIQLCYKFNALDQNKLPSRLKDKTNHLLAVLLRNDGKLNKAVALMEKVYKNLLKNACFDEACRALLELGAMYREFTWFDNALNLYLSFDVTLLSEELLKYRLFMNTGIIYKNKVQNELFCNDRTNDIYDNYEKSRKLFKKVYGYAKDTNHIPLQLEIIAELIESTVCGYYLDRATISEAVAYGKEMDLILPKYPVPVRQIQSSRMWARILDLQGKPLEAIEHLREGFHIAVHYNIPFRAADCCNQISDILCMNLKRNFITPKLLAEGIHACRYSIEYYTQLGQNDHVYLNNARKRISMLQRALDDIS